MQQSPRQKIRATDTFHYCGLRRTSYKAPNQLTNRKRKAYSTEQIMYTNQAEETSTFTPTTATQFSSSVTNPASRKDVYTAFKPRSKGNTDPGSTNRIQ